MTGAAVEVEHLSKRFRLYRERNSSLKATLLKRGRSRYEEFWALRDVSFEVSAGSTFGLIGENGSGKSTLLKCLAKILVPDDGRVACNGRVAALLELGSGFHPELSGRENVYLNASILGLSRKEVSRKFDEIVDFSGIGSFIDQPVKNYSSGMYVRLGFAVAINVEPDILLVDEVLAVGDAGFQRKCEERFAEFRASGRTVVLVSHAMSSMRSICDQVAWLDKGVLQDAGEAMHVVDDYVDETHEDRVVAVDGGVRWGSGEVLVERVELLDGHGRSRLSVATGEHVTLRLHYQVQEATTEPVFGFALETLEGVYLWAHNTKDAHRSTGLVVGAGYIDLDVPALPLQPGVFELSAAVVSSDTLRTFDYRKRLLRFDVLTGSPRESGGSVIFGGGWLAPVAARRVAG